MGDYTIGGKPVHNFYSQRGLEIIHHSEKFENLHNGDSDLNEEELGKILDSPLSEPVKYLSQLDGANHWIRNTGLAGKPFRALANEYQTLFKTPTREIEASLLRRKPSLTHTLLVEGPRDSIRSLLKFLKSDQFREWLPTTK